MSNKPIPTTILTGFLGSGKTTLLKRVLEESHGQKIAVIENEFGPEDIDSEILVTSEEQIIQMNNGCICCTIREDLAKTLLDLFQRKKRGELVFDRVVIETTGMADPGPVIQTFFVDDAIATAYQIDAVLTLVDAKHANEQLHTRLEARRQVGFADKIFISKADLVSHEELVALQHRLHAMNARAMQKVVHFGKVPIDEVLDLQGFNMNEQLELELSLADAHDHHHHDDHDHHDHDHHDHHDGHDVVSGEKDVKNTKIASTEAIKTAHHHHHHHFDDDVKSFVFKSKRPFNYPMFEKLMSSFVDVYGPNLYRYKGILYVQGEKNKIIFQGVHQILGGDLGPVWGKEEVPENKLVFIGVKLPEGAMRKGLEQCLV